MLCIKRRKMKALYESFWKKKKKKTDLEKM
jgi:hypothetical protein